MDIDEHVYRETFGRTCEFADNAALAIQAFGYEMISETFPDARMPLCDVVTDGVRSSEYSKLCLFDPSAITRTNFSYGRHSASPQGRVKWPAVREVLLLHYKKLGVNTRSRGRGTQNGSARARYRKEYGLPVPLLGWGNHGGFRSTARVAEPSPADRARALGGGTSAPRERIRRAMRRGSACPPMRHGAKRSCIDEGAACRGRPRSGWVSGQSRLPRHAESQSRGAGGRALR